MNYLIAVLIRAISSGLLIYGIYRETGKWTATGFFLVFFYIELTLLKNHLVNRKEARMFEEIKTQLNWQKGKQ